MRRILQALALAFIMLSAPAAQHFTAAAQTQPAPTPPAATQPAPTHNALIDINSASKEALDALPGVGPVRAAAIIKGRPYKGKDDLLKKKIIPQNVYNGIKDKIIARQKS
jgi:DNA uptake protein ComE-like DNA-binding protein